MQMSLLKPSGTKDQTYYEKKFDAACEIAVKDMEKQIPKKPIKSDTEIRYCEVWKCPSCGFEWSTRVVDFCYKCGQAIDYSEESEEEINKIWERLEGICLRKAGEQDD